MMVKVVKVLMVDRYWFVVMKVVWLVYWDFEMVGYVCVDIEESVLWWFFDYCD